MRISMCSIPVMSAPPLPSKQQEKGYEDFSECHISTT